MWLGDSAQSVLDISLHVIDFHLPQVGEAQLNFDNAYKPFSPFFHKGLTADAVVKSSMTKASLFNRKQGRFAPSR